MRNIKAYELTPEEAHRALIDAGFTPLVDIGNTIHFIRDGRRVVMALAADANLPLHENEIETVHYASFVRLDSGEIIAL